MKKTKVLFTLTIFLLLIAIVTSCAVPAGEDDEIDQQGLKFHLKDDGSYAVSIGDATALECITIPEKHNGQPVTEIANAGFMNTNYALGIPSTLNSIVIPKTVKIIGSHAFASCDSLTTVRIEGPSELTNIMANAFFNCTSLTEVYYTEGAESWMAIRVDAGNNDLTAADIYTYEDGEYKNVISEYKLLRAAEYLDTLYKNGDEITKEDYEVVGQLLIDSTEYNVTWAVDVSDGVTVKESGKTGFYIIDVTEYSMKEISYTLTATITSLTGESVTKSYNRTVPYCGVMSYDEYMAAEVGDTVIVAGVITAMTSEGAGSRRNDIFLQDKDGGYYVYDINADLVQNSIYEIGMTIEVVGVKDIYAGTHEIKGATIRLIRSCDITHMTPVDATEIVRAASQPNDAELMKLQNTLVTIKGVTLTSQNSGSGEMYYKFTLGELELYMRIHINDCPVLDEVQREQIITTHTESCGKTADVTGIAMVFNGGIYLVPVSVDAFSNIR